MADSAFLAKLMTTLSRAWAQSFSSAIQARGAAQALDSALTAAGVVPIGAIVAWHQSFTNTPALPSNFVKCNGQVLSDAGSVYNGQTIPDLNNNAGADGTGSFIRGSKTTTGTNQAADTVVPAHAHDLNNHTHTSGTLTFLDSLGGAAAGGYTAVGTSTASLKAGKLGGSTGAVVGSTATDGSSGTETRPKNFSMTWIMRVK